MPADAGNEYAAQAAVADLVVCMSSHASQAHHKVMTTVQSVFPARSISFSPTVGNTVGNTMISYGHNTKQ